MLSYNLSRLMRETEHNNSRFFNILYLFEQRNTTHNEARAESAISFLRLFISSFYPGVCPLHSLFIVATAGQDPGRAENTPDSGERRSSI